MCALANEDRALIYLSSRENVPAKEDEHFPDIWTKRFKLSVSQYRLRLWARARWRGASTKPTSQIMFEALDFTEI